VPRELIQQTRDMRKARKRKNVPPKSRQDENEVDYRGASQHSGLKTSAFMRKTNISQAGWAAEHCGFICPISKTIEFTGRVSHVTNMALFYCNLLDKDANSEKPSGNGL